jgi:hypothetical protein
MGFGKEEDERFEDGRVGLGLRWGEVRRLRGRGVGDDEEAGCVVCGS